MKNVELIYELLELCDEKGFDIQDDADRMNMAVFLEEHGVVVSKEE